MPSLDIPKQSQTLPGDQDEMQPQPKVVPDNYRPSDKLAGKVAIITGADSGIGRSIAVLYAKEGADVAVVYRESHDDAADTKKLVEAEGRKCLLIDGDVGDENFCRDAVQQTISELGRLNILINNAAEQHVQESLEDITAEQLERTFRTNIFGYFYMAKHALPHLGEGDSIINTTSVTAYAGKSHLLDYSSTKGAIVAFTRSLAQSLQEKKIRVNAVAPGPVWTPLIPATFSPEHVAEFGKSTIWEEPAQPADIAPTYVFIASNEARFYHGQVFHPNGGTIVQS